MWRLASLAIVLGCGASSALAAPQGATPSALALAQAAFASGPSASEPDAIGQILDHQTYAADAGLVRWDTAEAPLAAHPSGAVDTLRLSVGSVARGPGGLPLLADRADFDARDYEVTVVRHWPGAVRFEAGKLDVDLSPHAGVGLTSRGASSAEAGATLSLSQRAADRLKALGVRDGAAFGDQGRWYVFAAASGRAVGLNMLHRSDGWDRAGWSTDPTSRLVGDTQVGVGWRRGPMQTSVGFVHREVKSSHMLLGIDPKSDSMVALSFSVRPRR